MELPKTEKELRLAATTVMEALLQELESKGVDTTLDQVPMYRLYDIKAIAVWVARRTLRDLCPHLIAEGERDMSDEIPEDEDRPL